MNRKLKALGLALFAAFALSAIGASAASADKFISAEEKTILTSSGQHVKHQFTAFGGEVYCEVTNFSGTLDEKEKTEVTITPTYDECFFDTVPAVVRTNHCGYIFTSTTTPHDEEVHARVEVECESEGEQIEIEIPSFGHCNMTVPQQKTTKGVTYKNEEDEAGNKEVTVKVTAEVVAHRDKGSFLCNLLAETDEEALYEGASILKGYEDNGTPETEEKEGNGTLTFTDDETAAETTPEATPGTTHWDWTLKEGNRVDIEVEST